MYSFTSLTMFNALRVAATTSGSGLHSPRASNDEATSTARTRVSSTRRFGLSMPIETAAAIRETAWNSRHVTSSLSKCAHRASVKA